MASSRKDLEELHKLITRSFSDRIEQDIKDKIPTDAATMSAAVKFLKDNEVTADPADKEDLGGLRDKLSAAAAARQNKNKEVAALVALASGDMDNMSA